MIAARWDIVLRIVLTRLKSSEQVALEPFDTVS